MNEQIQHCLVVAVIIVSMAVGVAATRVNCRILSSGPIVVTPQAETNRARDGQGLWKTLRTSHE